MRAVAGPHSFARHWHSRNLASGRTICVPLCTCRRRTGACRPRSGGHGTATRPGRPRIGWSRRIPIVIVGV